MVLLALSLFAASVHSNPVFKTDERFELTGIVFYLAGCREYSMICVPSYKEAIDEWFCPYKDHELIKYVSERLRKERRIGYDAVATSAQMLDISGGGVALDSLSDAEKLCKADSRWTIRDLEKYVELLDDFYEKTDFMSFYEMNVPMYRTGEKVVSGMCRIDTSWFRSFYGKNFGTPELYVSFVNGPCNYALPDRGSMPGYGILMGIPFDVSDSMGIKVFGPRKYNYFKTVIHELCHNYTNPLYYEYASRFYKSGIRMFKDEAIRASMTAIGYGSPDVMTVEWLNTLFTAMYFKDADMLYSEDYGLEPTEDSKLMSWYVTNFDVKGKYFWMFSAIRKMDVFYEDREKYKTVSDFMPEIAKYYSKLSRNIRRERKIFESMYPEVTEVSVDCSLEDSIKVSFSFSEPMRTWHYSAERHPDKEVLLPPNSGSWFSLDKSVKRKYVKYESRRITFKFPKEGLVKGRRYGFVLTSPFYQSMKGLVLKEDYPFEFVY